MQNIRADETLIAYCGLYCGACTRFLAGKCPGCAKNEKAAWCGIRHCAVDRSYRSCADCAEFTEVNECGKFNNFISKIFGLVFRSDRRACIETIRKKGYGAFAAYMAENRLQSMKRP
jgi:hypothetical protein